jgi:hypothetical protein
MSELKDILNEKVNKINSTISNEDEKVTVLDTVKDMVEIFTEQVIRLSQKQDELDDRTSEIFDMLSEIEEELTENYSDEFEADCPFCGEKIQIKFPDENSTDFECPKCHNIIEMEYMADHDDHCGCGGCHGGCDDDCNCGDEKDKE